MNRAELQDSAWTFPNATIGGRPCKLSPARLSLLRRFKNPLITGESDFAAHPGAADEMAFVLSMPREQVKALSTMTDDQRAEAVMNFGLDFEDEIIGALAAINRQMQSVEASAVEAVEAPGKSPEAARQAPDGSPPSIGSQSETG